VTATPTRPRLTRAARRAQIAQAAALVLADRESTEVSFEDVAAAAGVSRSLVYKHFGDRGSLLAAAYLHDIERLDHQINAALRDCSDDDQRLRSVVAAYLGFAKANRASAKLIASLGTLRHPAVQSALHARVDRVASQFGDSPEALLVARGIVGLLESVSVYWADQHTTDTDEAVDLLVRVLRDGLNSVAADLGYSPVGALS